MRTFLTLMLLATLQTQTSFAFAQGVRDRCAVGECGGGEISPWFYAFLLGIFLLVTFYKLFWGSESEHKGGASTGPRRNKAESVVQRITMCMDGRRERNARLERRSFAR
jgi:hypothetical protein